ncbi:MAG: NTP transferase domain-containing protein [Myxococcota bacterium]
MNVDLVVLAGGQGRRMGRRLKPMLEAQGETLLARALRVWPGRRAFVVAPLELHEQLGAESLPARSGGLRFVADEGRGPAQAVVAAARASTAKWLLVAAADHPAPARSLAETLARWAQDADGAAVRDQSGRLQPLPSVLSRSGVLECTGAVRLGRLLASMRIAELSWERLSDGERGALLDVDTVEDARAQGIDPSSAPRLASAEVSVETRAGGPRRRS